MSELHDHNPAAFDAQLSDADVHVEAGNPGIEVTVNTSTSAPASRPKSTEVLKDPTSLLHLPRALTGDEREALDAFLSE
jgi:hypothetical protein